MEAQYSKFDVKMIFHKLYLAITFPCEVTLSLKRGQRRHSLKKNFPLDTQKFKCDFKNSLISFTAIFCKDPGTGKYIDGSNTASVMLVTQKGNKNAGHFQTSPTDVLNSGQTELKEQKVLLEKCPDKKAAMVYSIVFEKIKDMTEEEYR